MDGACLHGAIRPFARLSGHVARCSYALGARTDGADAARGAVYPGQSGCSRLGIGDDSEPMARAMSTGPLNSREVPMHQILAILAAAIALLAGGAAFRPMDASLPIGMAQPPPPGRASKAASQPINARPMDASLPIGM